MPYISKSSLQYKSADADCKVTKHDKINVILVDDSKVALTIFERVLLSSGQVNIAGKANSAQDALLMLDEVSADIILLDIEMPNRSGLDALPDIIKKIGDGKVIIVSSFVDSSGPSAIKALSLGACDTLSKPGKSLIPGEFAGQLIDKVLRLGRNDEPTEIYNAELKTNDKENPNPNPNPNQNKKSHHNVKKSLPNIAKPKAILIGASTGGIPSIQEFLEYLSDDVSAPIFIAQHLPAAFISYFARQLGAMGNRKIISVDNETIISDNNIYLAPGDHHIILKYCYKGHYAAPLEIYEHSHYKPSVDALFHSAASAYGDKALAILMSGMGHDGLSGARNLFDKKSHIWAQDKKSSVVWGMPGSAVNDGCVNAQLTPKEMAQSLNKIFLS